MPCGATTTYSPSTTSADFAQSQIGSTSYTQTSISNSQSPGISYSSTSNATGSTSGTRSATTSSTTSPQGSLVTMNQTFSAGQSETYSSTSSSGQFRSNAVSATTTISDYTYSNGDTYTTTSSESGNVSGSGNSLSTNSSFTLNQVLTGYKGQSTTNEKAWYALPDLSISSLTSADYTTFSATYGESGSFSGPGTMTESVVSSSSFTLSLTNVDSTTGLLSTAYQTVQGGQGSRPYTLYQTTNDNYTDTVTSSFVATQSNTAGAINETVVGGTSGNYNISDLTTSNGFDNETIYSGGSGSSYTDTYTPTGETETGSTSSTSTVTVLMGTTTTTTSSAYESTYSYSFPGAVAPTLNGMLSAWGVISSGSSGSSPGAGGSTSGSGGIAFSSASGSSSGSSGTSGLSGSSGSSGSSSQSSSSSGSSSSSDASNALPNQTQLPPLPNMGGIYVTQGAVTLPGTAAASNTIGTTNAMASGDSEQGQNSSEDPPSYNDSWWDWVNPASYFDSFRARYAANGEKIGALAGAMSSGIEQDLSIGQRNQTYAKLADPDSRMTVDQARQEIGASRKQLGREIAEDAGTVADAAIATYEITADTAMVIEGGAGAVRAVGPRPRIPGGGIQPRKTALPEPEVPVINCFPPDVLVDTETGLRAIAGIRPGDRVWAFDFASGEWQLAWVELRHDSNYDGSLVTIELEEGEVKSTAYHPFWVIEGLEIENRTAVRHLPPTEDRYQSLPGRWVNSHDVIENDIVFVRDRGPTRVRRVTQREVRTPVSNLTIRGLHTFCVGQTQVLVHNTSGTGELNPPKAGPKILSPGEAFEAGVKDTFRGKIIRENEILRDATGQIIGEIDFETAEALVEVGISLGGKVGQLHKLAGVAAQRGKQLIVVYGPDTAPGTLKFLKESLKKKWGNRVRFIPQE